MQDATDLVQSIVALHHETVARWHQQPPSNSYDGFLAVVCQQHLWNYLLWHEEDIARSPDAGDSRIATVKRAIDRYNQQRNDWIEKIDQALLDQLAELQVTLEAGARLNTETPGSAIDRLSILALRIYHLEEQRQRSDVDASHRTRTETRLAICHSQQRDLATSLSELLDDIRHGRKRLKLYRQLKMYNDPSFNPYLYAQGKER